MQNVNLIHPRYGDTQPLPLNIPDEEHDQT